MKSIIKVKSLTKSYGVKDNVTLALGPVDFDIKKGEFVVIIGRSGSGKSTLLNLLCGLDRPTKGSVEVGSLDLAELNRKELANYRSTIGIIFQSYNLLPNLTSEENMLLGSWAGNRAIDKEYVYKLTHKLGINHRLKARVTTLSGGEKQRVAIARSLVTNPDIIFCDEPTGALDSTNEQSVIEILKTLNKDGKTIILVTHNSDFEKLATKILHLNDGVLINTK
jgi:putative ABC transport system ATP-binding protein